MIADIKDYISITLAKRLVSPFVSTFLFCWCVANYNIWIVIFSSVEWTTKLAYIQHDLSLDFTSIGSFIVSSSYFTIPLIITLFYIFLWPKIDIKIYEYSRKQNVEYRELQIKLDKETPVSESKLKDFHERWEEKFSQYNKNLAQKNAIIQDLEKNAVELQSKFNSNKDKVREFGSKVYPYGAKNEHDFEAQEVLEEAKNEHDFEAQEAQKEAKNEHDFEAQEAQKEANNEHDFEARIALEGTDKLQHIEKIIPQEEMKNEHKNNLVVKAGYSNRIPEVTISNNCPPVVRTMLDNMAKNSLGLLKLASNNSLGSLTVHRKTINVGDEELIVDISHRLSLQIERAMKDLSKTTFIKIGTNNTFFVTHRGYEVADFLTLKEIDDDTFALGA
jgi:hypothetical protein